MEIIKAPLWFMTLMHLELTWMVCLAILIGCFWLIRYGNRNYDEGASALGSFGVLFAMWAMVVKMFVSHLTTPILFSTIFCIVKVAAVVLVIFCMISDKRQNSYT